MRHKNVVLVAIFIVFVLVLATVIYVLSTDSVNSSDKNLTKNPNQSNNDKKNDETNKKDEINNNEEDPEPNTNETKKPEEKPQTAPVATDEPKIDDAYWGEGRIYGKVFDSTKRPVNDIVVQLLDFGGKSAVEAKTVCKLKTKDEGDFDFDGIKNGTYKIVAFIENVGFDTSELVNLRTSETKYVEITVKKGIRLYGTVKDINGNPIDGAEIHCSYLENVNDTFQAMNAATTKTNVEGEYELNGLKAGSYWVQVTHANFATLGNMIAIQAEMEQDFVLTIGGAIHGVVKNENGEVVTKFKARCFLDADETAEDLNRNAVDKIAKQYITFESETGEFLFENLTTSEYAVEILADTYAQTFEKQIQVNANETSEVQITLTTGVELKGVVLEKESGKPIEGAKVSIAETIDIKQGEGEEESVYEYPFIESQELTAITDAEGKFVIQGLSKKLVHVWISHEEFPKTREQINLAAAVKDEYKFYMVADSSMVYGTVYDSEKQPCKGMYVVVQKNNSQNKLTAQSDDKGEYKIDKIAPGKYLIILVDVKGTIEQLSSFDIAKGQKLRIDLGSEAGITVSGKVTQNGEPVSSRQITFTSLDKKIGLKLSQLMKDGSYKVTLSEPGRYSVLIQGYNPKTGSVVSRFEVEIPETMEFTQDFEIQSNVIKGMIVSEATNEPINGSTVFIEVMSSKGSQDSVLDITRSYCGQGRTNAEGIFTINDITPGKYRLKIVARSHAIKVVENVEITGGEKDLGKIYMKQETRITGFITDESGTGIPGAKIVVSSASGLNLAAFIPIYSGEGGKYTLGGLAEGQYKILVHADGYARKILNSVTVSLENELSLDIVLKKGSSLTVFVKGSDGKPLNNADVSIYNSSGMVKPLFGGMSDLTPLGLTDIAGKTTRKSLEPGLYTIVISKDGYQTVQKKLSISAGLDSELDIILYNK